MTTVIAPGYAVLMDARQETSRTSGSGKQQPARDRIVRSAAALVRERGVHGVGLRQIVAHADGPRGSLQRYFPGGKTQLITEALNLAGAEVLDDTESAAPHGRHAGRRDRRNFRPLAPGAPSRATSRWDVPIAATVIDASGDDRLRQQARALLDQWRDSVQRRPGQIRRPGVNRGGRCLRTPRGSRGRPHLEPGKPEHPATRHGAALLHRVADAGRSQPRRSRAVARRLGSSAHFG